MKLGDDHDFGRSKHGSKAHIVAFGAPSMLILGSDNYDEDVHDRALCGTISDFDVVDEPDTESGYCYSCVRTAVSRGFVDDADPFTEADVRTRERHDSDRHDR